MKKSVFIGALALLLAGSFGLDLQKTSAADEDRIEEALPKERLSFERKDNLDNRPISPNFLNFPSVAVREVFVSKEQEDYEDVLHSIVSSQEKDSVIARLYLDDENDEGYVLETLEDGTSYVHVIQKHGGSWSLVKTEKFEWKKKRGS